GATGARTLATNALVCGGLFAATGLVPWFSGVLVLMFVGGCSMAFAEVAETTIMQSRIEDAIRARVMAAYSGLMSAVFGMNLALAASFVGITSPGTAYVFGGAWCVVAAAGFQLFARELAREEQALADEALAAEVASLTSGELGAQPQAEVREPASVVRAR
ncbi:MAG: hypothetical protein JWN72_2716, partial [Thermoleophilia bacterium]|nr:hypothetical protein [Thermoleophilia bacterium]